MQRTTITAEPDDIAMLKNEARRRGLSLSALLKEVVRREAEEIRAARRPTIGVVSQPVSVAEAMSSDPDAPHRSEISLR